MSNVRLRVLGGKRYDPAIDMSGKRTTLEAWRPVSPVDVDAVRAELERVLASQQFCNSKRYPALLRFVVETTLAGHADELKERTLGVEVFQRPSDYDTNTDTVVRYTAGEVRKRLSLYYHEHDPGGGVQISLPAGSYVPEFQREMEEVEDARREPTPASPLVRVRTVIVPGVAAEPVGVTLDPVVSRGVAEGRKSSRWRVAALVVVLVVAGFGVRSWMHRPTALDQFWGPMFGGNKAALLCSGASVFGNNGFSGTETAGSDIDYPFVSMQIASGISHVSGMLERGGLSYEVQASGLTPLTDMRDRPIVLLGGYNNLWTLRLLAPLRFHFAERPGQGIVDREHPEEMLFRDHAPGYGNADDYAIVARFRDTTTGSMVLVLAGLGRNGTEAASQFVTSQDSMRLLQEKVAGKLADKNIEVVLKASVIGGRTGAPSIQKVYVW